MKLSKIVQSATLTLLVGTFSLLGSRIASADAQEDLHTANLRVDAFHDAAGDLHRLSHEEAAAQPDRIEAARRAADEAQDALNKTRWAIVDEFQRGQIHIETAVLLEQYLMKAEAGMREASRWMSELPAAPVDQAGMTAQEAIRLLRADASVLTNEAGRAENIYGYHQAGSAIQAAFDRLGSKCGAASNWGGFLWMDLSPVMTRLTASRDRISREANRLAGHPERLNAGYVRYLHAEMAGLNADAARFFDLAGRITDNLGHQGLALDHAHANHEPTFGTEEYKALQASMKTLWKEFSEANLVQVPQTLGEWSREK